MAAPTLIYDRTEADVIARNAKGIYTAEDMNRVETAVGAVASLLQAAPGELEAYGAALDVAADALFALPYDPDDYSLTTKTDWQFEHPTASQLARYLGNVQTLTEALSAIYPVLPESMARLDWQGANAIEAAVLVVYDALQAEIQRIKGLMDRAAQAWFFSGDLYAGEIAGDASAPIVGTGLVGEAVI